MKTIANKTAVRLFQGFEVYVLSNENVELAIVPCLGSKIISLKNLQTAREWLWHPDGGLKLFRNYANDDFSKSPLVGIDECLPTIAPCSWRGRELPDHGEVWAAACDLNAEAWEYGVLKTAVRLKLSPFTFERTIELNENEILISYQLTNHSAKEEHFLWALHPLLRLQPGDQLELPQSTRHLLNGASWIDDVDSAIPEGQCAKIFAAFATEGAAAICNQETGDRLEFEWDIAEMIPWVYG
ncbi:MAG: hypothetical protein WDM76_04765 [Limisphaerales bacterium]